MISVEMPGGEVCLLAGIQA